MELQAILFLCWFLPAGASADEVLQDEYIAEASDLIDEVLEEFPVRECDSLVVWPESPPQAVGRSTIFFTNVNDLIGAMEDEEFVLTLSGTACLVILVKSDDFAATAREAIQYWG